MNDLKRLFSYLGPYKRDLMLAAAFILIEATFELIIPSLIADLIDKGVSLGDVHFMV